MFGDTTAAKEAKAAARAFREANTSVWEADSGKRYVVSPDSPPGIGWVVQEEGTYAVPKSYWATKELAVANINVIDRRRREKDDLKHRVRRG